MPLFFAECGVVTGDGGKWLRKQCLILARNNATPVGFWLALRLRELGSWIETNNEIIRDGRSKRRV